VDRVRLAPDALVRAWRPGAHQLSPADMASRWRGVLSVLVATADAPAASAAVERRLSAEALRPAVLDADLPMVDLGVLGEGFALEYEDWAGLVARSIARERYAAGASPLARQQRSTAWRTPSSGCFDDARKSSHATPQRPHRDIEVGPGGLRPLAPTVNIRSISPPRVPAPFRDQRRRLRHEPGVLEGTLRSHETAAGTDGKAHGANGVHPDPDWRSRCRASSACPAG
jgi:hypothetical protein